MSQGYGESPYEELQRFRNFSTNGEDIEIPLMPENRRKTDSKYTITFIVLVILLIPLLVYTLAHSGFHNLAGTDDCGNFCGFKNEKIDEWNCTGKDFTDKRFLLIERSPFDVYPKTETKTCVEFCPSRNTDQKCIDNLDGSDAAAFGKALSDIGKGWWIIILSVIISCLLCFGMVLLFRYAVDFTVWFLLISFIGIFFIASAFCWFRYSQAKDENSKDAQPLLVYACVFGGIGIFAVLITTCLFRKVQLIIQLFKESAKAIFEIPGLSQLPLLTFLGIILTLVAAGILLVFLFTARTLVEIMPNHLSYQPNGVMIFTIIYNFFMFMWVMQFLAGAQYIIIAGAVSTWFFTRNKQYLDRPLWTSFMNFIKFHLGTVLIGSLVITLVNFLRMILKGLASNSRTRWIIDCLCSELIAFLKLFSKNAYIQTAMHGQPFFKSGKRAVKILVSNVDNVIAVNSIGDFILAMAQALLIVFGGAVAVFIATASGNAQASAISVICCILIAFLVIIFFGIFEATIDSLFICFCEDKLINDGMARPYYMTKGLHEFIENCKGGHSN